MRHLTETDRDRYGGGYDNRAINAHSERTYRDGANQFWRLVRDLEDELRPFQAYGPFPENFAGFLPAFEVDGRKSFGETRSWSSVERMLDDAVGTHLEHLYGLDRIMTPEKTDDEYGWRILQQGLSGVRVEIWEVNSDHIDRGVWGSWIEEAGWYWQRMDVAELHGPFGDLNEAQLDFYLNRNETGILHPNDRPDAEDTDEHAGPGIRP